MEEAIINSFLYVITLLIYVAIRRKLDVGFVLLSLYTMTSIICVLYLKDHQSEWVLNTWSFVYLYVIIILALRPFLIDMSAVIDNIKIRNVKFLNFFIYGYCLLSLIDIYYSFSTAIKNIVSGEWGTLRMEMYAGDLQLYDSQIERFSKIFVSYLRPLAIIVLFLGISDKKINKKWLIFLLLSILVSAFLVSINTASRGLLFALIASFLCAFILFKNRLSSSSKKKIYIAGLSFSALFLIYSIAVTKSRFGDDDQYSSLLYYFGHAMLTFNYGLTDSINTFANGSFFFDWFIKLFGWEPVATSQLGTHFGTRFFTFVGSWYIDFGPNGTFLVALLMPIFFIRLLKRKVIGVAELFISFVYLNYLFMGVFVVGRGNFLVWLISYIIYKFLKFKKI